MSFTACEALPCTPLAACWLAAGCHVWPAPCVLRHWVSCWADSTANNQWHVLQEACMQATSSLSC